MQTIAALLHSTIAQNLPRNEAHYLMLHICGRETHDRAWLLTHEQDVLNAAQQDLWQRAVQRRATGEPVAYIVGFKEFYGLRLSVDRRVLDPRDDTETLVDWAVQLIPANASRRLLDLGTGSGAIALAIKSQRPLVQVYATDASPDALAVASANSAQLGLPVCLIQADRAQPNWFAALGEQRFHYILSNPPYIAEHDDHLHALRHEPELALKSGADGLDSIRNIIAHAAEHLEPAGWLLLEHGYDQADRVQDLFARANFSQICTKKDLNNQPRCTGGQRG
jgi:release factor glutamine methyltransferase